MNATVAHHHHHGAWFAALLAAIIVLAFGWPELAPLRDEPWFRMTAWTIGGMIVYMLVIWLIGSFIAFGMGSDER